METRIALVFFILIMSLGFVGCEREPDATVPEKPDFKVYTLDVSGVEGSRRGMLVISHNAVAAFPLDLSAENRELTEMGSTTIIEAQTLSACDGSGVKTLADDHHLVRNITAAGPIETKDIADVRSIRLEMPFRTQHEDFDRIPGTFCVGFHLKGNGWVWDFTPVRPELDNDARKGFGQIAAKDKNVDIVAVLFDTTTNIDKIEFEAKKSE